MGQRSYQPSERGYKRVLRSKKNKCGDRTMAREMFEAEIVVRYCFGRLAWLGAWTVSGWDVEVWKSLGVQIIHL